jgi:hypothetical protein
MTKLTHEEYLAKYSQPLTELLGFIRSASVRQKVLDKDFFLFEHTVKIEESDVGKRLALEVFAVNDKKKYQIFHYEGKWEKDPTLSSPPYQDIFQTTCKELVHMMIYYGPFKKYELDSGTVVLPKGGFNYVKCYKE